MRAPGPFGPLEAEDVVAREGLGEPTQVAVWNVSDSGAAMTANFDIVFFACI